MNKEQATHAKSMANKINVQLHGMKLDMDYLLKHASDPDFTADIAIRNFEDLSQSWNEIESVVNDMMPRMEDLARAKPKKGK